MAPCDVANKFTMPESMPSTGPDAGRASGRGIFLHTLTYHCPFLCIRLKVKAWTPGTLSA